MSTQKTLSFPDKQCILAYTEFLESGNEFTLYQLAKKYNVTKKRLYGLRDHSYTTLPNEVYVLKNESYEIWQEIIDKLLLPETTLKEIIKEYNVNRESISKMLILFLGEKKGKEIYKDKTTSVKFNRDIFKNIKTETDWYWIGFLAADGGVYKTSIRLKLGGKDKDHLEKYCDWLGLDYSYIKPETVNHSSYKNGPVTCYKVDITDKEMVADAAKFNLVPQKTMVEIPLYDVPEEYIFAYMRGLFDGDGSIKSNLININFVGSLEMVTWFRDTINKYFGHPAKIHTKGKIYSVEWYNQKAKTDILNWWYENSTVYLERKFNLYQQIVQK